MAIELSSLTFTHQADIVPLFGTAEIINTGTANALNGDDRITATGGLFGLVTGLPFTTSGGTINTGNGNDTITGSATAIGGGSGIAIYGAGTINTGNGNDSIIATGAYDGLTNNGDFVVSINIDTGNGDDIITGQSIGSSGNGITNSGIINTGDGDDIITGGATGTGAGIQNFGTGVIDTGNGNDIVDALHGGFSTFNGIGIFILGKGADIIKGFGSGRFDGGSGKDMLLFGAGEYEVSASANGDGFYTVSKGGINMFVKDFEFIGSASNPSSAFDFSSALGGSFTIAAASPTYTLKSSATELFEGDRLSVSIATTDVPSGKPLYWSLSGAGVTSSDFSEGMTTGTGAVGADGRYTFSTVIAVDSVSDPNESLQIKFFSDAGRTTQIGDTLAVLVKELPVGNPTDSSDIIQGTSNDASTREIISGIPLSSTLRGKQSVDFLTGLEGPDTFVLGDAEGSFYDDGIAAQKGSRDLGVILDFGSGDLIQLHGSPADYKLSKGAYTGGGFTNMRGFYISQVTPGSLDEVVGFIKGASLDTLSLTSNDQFVYAL